MWEVDCSPTPPKQPVFIDIDSLLRPVYAPCLACPSPREAESPVCWANVITGTRRADDTRLSSIEHR